MWILLSSWISAPDFLLNYVLFLFFSIEFYLSWIFIFIFLCQPVQEPEKMTQIIVEALEITKQRGIINKGWGGLGNCKSYIPF